MGSILPFIPTDAEQQTLLAQKYIKNAGNLATANLQAPEKKHGQSGSNWTITEANAVRGVPILDVDPTRIVPQKYFPGRDNEYFIAMRKHIREATIDNLKSYRETDFLQNPYRLFFEDLAELTTTFTSEESIMNAHRRTVSQSSVETDLSTSSNEGKSEVVSVRCLKNFIKLTLPYMRSLNQLPVQGTDKPALRCYANPVRFEWTMAGVKHVAVNDGSIGLNFPGNYTRSDRKTDKPVASLEGKDRDAGGIKRGSGEPQRFIDNIFAQELAELIGSMAAQRSYLKGYPKGRESFIKNQYSDQETFVISMHGTIFYISAAYFPPEYIQYIEANDSTGLDINKIFLWVRRSVHFDLKDVEARAQALGFLWALISYIASGEAKINIVAAAIEQCNVGQVQF